MVTSLQRSIASIAVVVFVSLLLQIKLLSSSKKTSVIPLSNHDDIDDIDDIDDSSKIIGSSSSRPSTTTCSPCIVKYINRMKQLNIRNGISYEEWQYTLCGGGGNIGGHNSTSSTGGTSTTKAPPPTTTTSTHELILGAGPGTTATRSFAVAINMLGKSVVHWKVWLNSTGYGRGRAPKTFHIQKLMDGFHNLQIYHEITQRFFPTEAARAYENTEAILDYPIPFYATDFIRIFPNIKIIMTHRDPYTWYVKRTKFCGEMNKSPDCDVPFVLRPFNMHLKNMTAEQAAQSFLATEQTLKCLVGPDRYLEVDAWKNASSSTSSQTQSQPQQPIDWLSRIANFLDVPTPPPEANCFVPKDTGHSLNCKRKKCDQCYAWIRAQK